MPFGATQPASSALAFGISDMSSGSRRSAPCQMKRPPTSTRSHSGLPALHHRLELGVIRGRSRHHLESLRLAEGVEQRGLLEIAQRSAPGAEGELGRVGAGAPDEAGHRAGSPDSDQMSSRQHGALLRYDVSGRIETRSRSQPISIWSPAGASELNSLDQSSIPVRQDEPQSDDLAEEDAFDDTRGKSAGDRPHMLGPNQSAGRGSTVKALSRRGPRSASVAVTASVARPVARAAPHGPGSDSIRRGSGRRSCRRAGCRAPAPCRAA